MCKWHFFLLFDVNGRVRSRQQPHIKPVNTTPKKDKKKKKKSRFVKVRGKKTADCCRAELARWPVKRLLLTNVLFDCHRRSHSSPPLHQACCFKHTHTGVNGHKHTSWTTCTYKNTVQISHKLTCSRTKPFYTPRPIHYNSSLSHTHTHSGYITVDDGRMERQHELSEGERQLL